MPWRDSHASCTGSTCEQVTTGKPQPRLGSVEALLEMCLCPLAFTKLQEDIIKGTYSKAELEDCLAFSAWLQIVQSFLDWGTAFIHIQQGRAWQPGLPYHPNQLQGTSTGAGLARTWGLAQWDPWSGMAGLWGAGAKPCSSLAGTDAPATDAGSWAPGKWGSPGGGQEQAGLVVPPGPGHEHQWVTKPWGAAVCGVRGKAERTRISKSIHGRTRPWRLPATWQGQLVADRARARSPCL